eukprot:CAMPEP_0206159654 /NCGR_PEP_ID=MMETSP1474-20131121/6042_1 /ASSEMBLY_ACC=CAM_ASM_001110 /TAXON_ID=97495 /ORGANISM="Imantonia sp., Strain RCC918" /LENGTH=314 /DNA_ID=CAMNT_0053560511 /DNA_START=80 /DNA_END=1022 /DNA_ORIENTATION=+
MRQCTVHYMSCELCAAGLASQCRATSRGHGPQCSQASRVSRVRNDHEQALRCACHVTASTPLSRASCQRARPPHTAAPKAHGSELVLHLAQERDALAQPASLLRRHLLAFHALQPGDLRVDRRLVEALLGGNVLALLLAALLERLDVAPGGGHLVALDLDDLHREDEHVAAANLGRGAAVAVPQLGGDVHLPLVALHHELHRLSPAPDHLVRREGRRRAAIVRGVKLVRLALWVLGVRLRGAALVVALARRVRCRVAVAVTTAQHLVLQPARQRDHAILALVLVKELDAEVVGRGADSGEQREPEQHFSFVTCH